jgi:hypothetical protein
MQSFRKWQKFAMLAIVGLWASSVVGCSGRFTGGGYIDSVAGAPAKATFGINFEGIDDGSGQGLCIIYRDPITTETYGVGKGHGDYNDHGAGVKFQFDCDKVGFPLFDNRCFYYGRYNSEAGDGDVYVAVTANGDPFDHSDDALYVDLHGGPYDGYSNSGTIKGGNFTWHPPK